MAEPTPAALDGASKLCERCSVIRFNDAELLGKYLRQEEDGSKFLILPNVFASYAKTKHALDYQLTDTLPELPVLKGNADSGCEFCRTIREEILRIGTEFSCDLDITLSYYWGDEFHFSGIGMAVLVAELDWYNPAPDVPPSTLNEIPTSVLFAVESDDELVSSWLRIPKSRKRQVLCPENISFMKDSISLCKAECRHLRAGNITPTRLLDVSSQVRLVENTGFLEVSNQQPPDFAALSYCWGGKGNQLQTTTGTIAAHKAGIDDGEFPQVIRDAIQVCRALDIGYLWVDALCIIQDDSTDWQQESSSMGLIYNNAVVTLVASSSDSCEETFLCRHYKKVTVPFVSRLNQTVAGQYDLLASGYGTYGSLLTWSEADQNRRSWETRGWTFQEDVMSTRKLLFGDSMIHFMCGSANLQENHADLKTRLRLRDAIEITSSLEALLKPNDLATKRLVVYERWPTWLSSYNQKSLTVERDRLPAVSGIAKICSEILGGDTYLAGLWKDDMPYCLMWRAHTSGNPEYCVNLDQFAHTLRQKLDRPGCYIAPSWSFLHLRHAYTTLRVALGSDFVLRSQFTPRCSTDGHTTISGSNPYGEVDRGWLNVIGKTFTAPSPLFLFECQDFLPSLWHVRDRGRLVVTCALDCFFEETPWSGDLTLLLLGSSNHGFESLLEGSHTRRYDEDERPYHCRRSGVHSSSFERANSTSGCCDECRKTDSEAAASISQSDDHDDSSISSGARTGSGSHWEEDHGSSQAAEARSPRALAETEHLPATPEWDLGQESAVSEDGADGSPEREESYASSSDFECGCDCHWVKTVWVVQPTCEYYNYYDKVGTGWREDNEDCFGLVLMPATEGVDDGRYIRVGIWESLAADGGGMKYVEQFEEREVTIL